MQKPYLRVWERKLPHFMGGCIGPRMEIFEILGLPIPMVPRLHQSNGYIKKKLRVGRAKKCNALVGAETVLSNAGPRTTPFNEGQNRAENRSFCKFNCFSLWKTPTYLCGSANYLVSWVAVQGRERKYSKFRAYESQWHRVCTKPMVIFKGSYVYIEHKNVMH